GPDVGASATVLRDGEQTAEDGLVSVRDASTAKLDRTAGSATVMAAEENIDPAPATAEEVQNGAVTVLVRWKDSGEPASATMVSLRAGKYTGSLHQRARRMTDKDGRAEFTSVRPGEHQVSLHAGLRDSQLSIVVEPGVTLEVELTLPKGISMEGVVLDAKGARAPGAEIVWMNFFGHAEVVALSNESGAFLFQGVLADGDLFARNSDEAPSARRECPVSEGSQADIILRLRGPGASIEGVVLDESDQPIPDAKVSLGTSKKHIDGPNGSETVHMNRPARLRALTDAEGRFEFLGVAPIEWTLLVDRREFMPLDKTVALVAGARESVRLTLSTGGTVHGTVTDAQGAPVEGVRIFNRKDLKGGLSYSRHTRTDREGAYELTGLPRSPGLPFMADRIRSSDAADTVLDLDSAPRVEWSPVVKPPSGLSGVVIGVAGEPLSKLIVVAIGNDGGWNDMALTGADGTFSMGEDVQDARDLSVMRPGRPGRPQHPLLSLHLEKNVFPVASPIVIQISEEDLATGSVEGRILDDTGRVPSGSELALELWNYPVATTTTFAADGSFALEEIPVGTFDVRFSAPDRADWNGRVTVEAGRASDVGEIPSSRGGLIQWEPASLQTSGWPEGLSVAASSAAGGELGPFPLSEAGEHGPLASGEYNFRFAAAGYSLTEVHVHVGDGETTLVVVPAANPQEGPTFRVEGAKDAFIKGRVVHAGGGTALTVEFLGDNDPHELALPALVDGEYVLHLETLDQRTAAHPFQVPGGAAGSDIPTVTLR
ncbi:MAG: protocatechuate 3,4-dioxygenase beta subunit, partial [Planctomycetota bacterium]